MRINSNIDLNTLIFFTENSFQNGIDRNFHNYK